MRRATARRTVACLRTSVKLIPSAASRRCSVLRLTNMAAATSSIGAAARRTSMVAIVSLTSVVDARSHAIPTV